MAMAFLVTILGLALVDSTSIGTLVIPIWLLLIGTRLRARQYTLYVATIACFYFLIGLLVLTGLDRFMGDITTLLSTRIAFWVQAILGISLFIYAFMPDAKDKNTDDRFIKWHKHIRDGSLSSGSIVRLAFGAGLVELSTMLPYIAAIGLLITADFSLVTQVTWLAGYVTVMVLPAITLIILRNFVYRALGAKLEKLSNWMVGNASKWLKLISGIVGFFLARDAIARLFVPGFM